MLKLRNYANLEKFDKEYLSIRGTIGKLKDLPISLLKEDILGKDYELSVAFVGPRTSRKLNRTYREKDYPTNVLSFPLDKKTGELVLCMEVIKKEFKKWDKNLFEFTGFLVIHGMLHLKGMDHGSIMEKQEQKFYAKYFHRDRSGLVEHARGNRRIRKR